MNSRWAAVLRIAVGIFFLAEGLGKLDWYGDSGRLRAMLERSAQGAAAPSLWYQEHVAKPGVELWARIIPTGELLIAAGLILGILARPATIIAFFMVLNFHLTNGTLFRTSFFSTPSAWLLLVCLVVIYFTRAWRELSAAGS